MKTQVVAERLDFLDLWNRAIPYEEFVGQAQKYQDLWQGVYRTVRISQELFEQACEAAEGIEGVRFLVIAEDWCWDAALTVPILARLADESKCAGVRILRRDDHPEVMNQYLTNGTRSIPIVIVLDGDYRERGSWGPRPRELQAWAVAHKPQLPKDEFRKKLRRMYAQDRGRSTIRELFEVFESGS